MKITNTILKKKLPEIEKKKIPQLKEVAEEMLRFVKSNNAIGLAANQVGIPKRMFIMSIEGEDFVCVNPIVLSESPTVSSQEEGCLSFDKKTCEVERPVEIVVEYSDIKGDIIQKTFNGIRARCFLHELDHLNGITMFKRKSEAK
jgi:peptide deformylase